MKLNITDQFQYVSRHDQCSKVKDTTTKIKYIIYLYIFIVLSLSNLP